MGKEIISRLNDIVSGPWTNRGKMAEEFILHAKESQLRRVFRAHWEGPIITREELLIRDSFDESLTVLKLIELAVETGYLEVDEIKDYSAQRFNELLSSPSAMGYLFNYGYITVFFLARRIEINLNEFNVVPPPIDPEGSLRFASFFSLILNWYEEEDIQYFLGLLDYYVYYGDDRSEFLWFLESGVPKKGWRKDEVEYYSQLLSGAYQFVTSLDDLMTLLSEKQQKYFGSFFSYWLALFFGYDFEKGCYVKRGINWSNVDMATSLFSQGEVYTNPDELKSIFNQKIERLRAVWERTKLFLEEGFSIESGQ